MRGQRRKRAEEAQEEAARKSAATAEQGCGAKGNAAVEIIEHLAPKARRIPSQKWRDLIKKVWEDGNIQAFDKSAHGTQLAFASLSAKTTDFRNNVRNSKVDMNVDFFGSDKPAEDDRNA